VFARKVSDGRGRDGLSAEARVISRISNPAHFSFSKISNAENYEFTGFFGHDARRGKNLVAPQQTSRTKPLAGLVSTAGDAGKVAP